MTNQEPTPREWLDVEDLAQLVIDFTTGWQYVGKQERDAKELETMARDVLNMRPYAAVARLREALEAAASDLSFARTLMGEGEADNYVKDALRKLLAALDAAPREEQ